jgi:hypothetical protein
MTRKWTPDPVAQLQNRYRGQSTVEQKTQATFPTFLMLSPGSKIWDFSVRLQTAPSFRNTLGARLLTTPDVS